MSLTVVREFSNLMQSKKRRMSKITETERTKERWVHTFVEFTTSEVH